MKQKIFAWLLTLALTASLLPDPALAAAVDVVTDGTVEVVESGADQDTVTETGGPVVATSGDQSYTARELMSAVGSETGGSFTLCADISGQSFQIFSGASVTIDLAGYAISHTSDVFSIMGNLTLTDSTGGSGSVSGTIRVAGGSLAIAGGTYYGDIADGSAGSVTLTGGSYYYDTIYSSYVPDGYCVRTNANDGYDVYEAFTYTFGEITPAAENMLIVIYDANNDVFSNARQSGGRWIADSLNVAETYSYEITAPGYQKVTGTISHSQTEGSPIQLTPVDTGITWAISNGTLTISGSGPMENYSSAPFAPWYGGDYASIVIDSGVTAIGDRSCTGSQVQSVSIPDTVTSIGEVALGFTSMTQITIPASVDTIGAGAFDSSNGLTIRFLGDAPALADDVFFRAAVTVEYPAGNESWDNVIGRDYGAESVNWKPYGGEADEEEKDTPELSIIPSRTTLTGGGTITLTVSGIPEGGTAALTAVGGAFNETIGNGTFRVEFPDADQTYRFQVSYAGNDDYAAATASCTVRVYESDRTDSPDRDDSGHAEQEPDPSTTTATDPDTGTVTETTEYPDGSVKEVKTATDGTVTTTKTEASGVVHETTQTPNGNVYISVSIPASTATDVDIVLDEVAANVTTVPMDPDTGEIIKTAVPGDDGYVIRVDHSADLILVDNAKDFNDTTGHWASDAINFVAAREIFSGTSNTAFSPDASMTRAMLMTVLARFDGQDTAGGSVWYESAMNWAMENGISDGSDPNGNISREQLAVMLYRYAGSPTVSGDIGSFADAGQVSDYAVDAMRWAVGTGLISGTSNDILSPQGNATRAQVATILMRFCENLVQ